MKRFTILTLVLLTMLLLLSLSMAEATLTGSSGSILKVPVDYPTIQAAIDAALWGDTVLVAPGEYVESIRLKPGITVQSAEGPEVTTIRGEVMASVTSSLPIRR